MADLMELAERLERASGEYDPLLCSDIHDVLPEPKCVQPPNYCASLDAAMTLVPEGWWVGQLAFCPPDFRSDIDREWHAEIAGPITWETLDCGPEPQYECEGGNAATPALALCAAALRARASNG